MGSPSVNPKITEAEKAELARRYAAGETLAALTQAFGCWTQTAKRAITKNGGRLRPEDTTPRVCRVCGGKVPSPTKRALCPAHIRQFCSVCDDPLPPGRANRWCSACEAAHKERYYAQERRCPQCGTGTPTPRGTLCSRCQRTSYRLQRAARLQQPGACRRCGTGLPPGRINRYCTACARKRERDRRKAMQRRGEHRCGMCGTGLRLREKSYCGGCNTMIANWRRAWHAGNKIARQLGTVRTPRRWQQDP